MEDDVHNVLGTGGLGHLSKANLEGGRVDLALQVEVEIHKDYGMTVHNGIVHRQVTKLVLGVYVALITEENNRLQLSGPRSVMHRSKLVEVSKHGTVFLVFYQNPQRINFSKVSSIMNYKSASIRVDNIVPHIDQSLLHKADHWHERPLLNGLR